MDVEIVTAERGQVFAVCGPVVLRIIDQAATHIGDVDRGVGLLERVLERYDRAAAWVIIHHGTPVPSAAAFNHSARRTQHLRGRVGFAFTTLGLGFWATQSHRVGLELRSFLNLPAPVDIDPAVSAERLAAELADVAPLDSAALLNAYARASQRMIELRAPREL